jgi:hypothetical protein
MSYRIFHIFTNTLPPESAPSYRVKSRLLERILSKLGLLVEVEQHPEPVSFAHSVLSPAKIQEVTKDQIALLRTNQLEPLCIFIGSKDYVQLCEYADFQLIQQVSYIETLKLLEEFTQTLPLSNQDTEINRKVFELVSKESKNLINHQLKRIPGSLVVSGYKFLNLPMIILPWLSGVFVAPNLSTEPNTTVI